MRKEKWASVPYEHFENAYEVSNFGNVRSLTRMVNATQNGVVNSQYQIQGKELKKRTNNIEELLFCDLSYTENGVRHRKSAYIHKMVAMCFVLNTNSDYDKVTHIDGNKRNNHYLNLKWTNQSEISKKVMENPKNRFALKNINIKNGYYKKLRVNLSESDIDKIIELKKQKTLKELSQQFNVSVSTISKITRYDYKKSK